MRLEEEKFLFNRVFDDFYEYYPNGARIDELIDGFSTKKILLQFNDEEGTKVIDEDCVKEIKKAIPYIQRIVEKPRSFIKSIEEKVPVETAKRINSNAILHLGRNSNDWYARTFLTVKPKNIVSDINEETIDLYENRFVKTLIDRIILSVAARRIKLENLYGQVEDNNILSVLDNSRNNYIRMQANSDRLLKVLSKDNNSSVAAGYTAHMRDELDEVRALERKIVNLRYSDFYSKLRKCRKVKSPIEKTNIIMFDANYNRCYKLWEYLNSVHQEEDYSFDEEEEKQYSNYYYAYVVFNVIASMHNSGYEERNNPIINYDDDVLTINGDMIWIKGDTQIRISLVPKEHKVVLSLLIDEKANKYDVFEIYTDYTNFEGMSRSQVDDRTTDIISALSKREKRSQVTSKYCFVSLDINACSASNDFGETIYRRLFNIGDNYAKDEKDIENKSYYKTGIQILSPLDLRYNFLHIQRIINSHILRNKDFRTMPSTCPLCGSTKVRKGTDYIDCHECGHRISMTSCSNCKEENLLWIKYVDDSLLLNEKTITDAVKEKPYYFQLMKYETIMGPYAVSSFRFDEEVTGWKLKSICPKCGVVLGEIDK
ncbi:MAG: DUF2357 domain-containing protein [Clostridiales bacterium]|nr:DUF2357 domain-containing protein [Clostridiales bacterium]